MNKAFLLLIAAMVASGVVWFSAGTSGSNTVSTDVYSWFFLKAKAGEHVPAQINTVSGDWQELPCVATGKYGYVTCQFPAEYAGQQVAVELTRNDVMYLSLVDVPAR